MSYDLKIRVKAEGCDKYPVIAYPELDTPTYNLGKMLRACMDWDFEPSRLYLCSEVISKIERGIKELTYNPKKYEKYNPANGWGDLNGALNVLCSLRDCIYEQAEEIPLNCLYMSW